MIIREKKYGRKCAVKVLDYVLTNDADCCDQCVDAGGLKSIFPVFMGKSLKKKCVSPCACIALRLANLTVNLTFEFICFFFVVLIPLTAALGWYRYHDADEMRKVEELGVSTKSSK